MLLVWTSLSFEFKPVLLNQKILKGRTCCADPYRTHELVQSCSSFTTSALAVLLLVHFSAVTAPLSWFSLLCCEMRMAISKKQCITDETRSSPLQLELLGPLFHSLSSTPNFSLLQLWTQSKRTRFRSQPGLEIHECSPEFAETIAAFRWPFLPAPSLWSARAAARMNPQTPARRHKYTHTYTRLPASLWARWKVGPGWSWEVGWAGDVCECVLVVVWSGLAWFPTVLPSPYLHASPLTPTSPPTSRAVLHGGQLQSKSNPGSLRLK